jgi:hypothetical protein
MSEHARERSEQIQYSRSRRLTTTSDSWRAMREQQAKELSVGPSKYELQGPTE